MKEEFPWLKIPDRNRVTKVRIRILPAQPLYMVSKGHALNGRTFYCERGYPAITRQYDILLKEFREQSFIPIHAEGCPACEAWREGSKNQVPSFSNYGLETWLRKIKPFYRFNYQCIVRGEEDKGIRILSAGKQLHQNIITGLSAVYPFELPKKTRWQSFKTWLRSWFGYVEPKPDLLDWQLGADFLIRRENRGYHEMTIPDYSNSCFDAAPTPVGDIFQIDEWRSNLYNLEAHLCKDDFAQIKVVLESLRGNRDI